MQYWQLSKYSLASTTIALYSIAFGIWEYICCVNFRRFSSQIHMGLKAKSVKFRVARCLCGSMSNTSFMQTYLCSMSRRCIGWKLPWQRLSLDSATPRPAPPLPFHLLLPLVRAALLAVGCSMKRVVTTLKRQPHFHDLSAAIAACLRVSQLTLAPRTHLNGLASSQLERSGEWCYNCGQHCEGRCQLIVIIINKKKKVKRP